MAQMLKLGDTLALPADEAVTQKYGFIGRSGSGKSYAAMRLAELFLGMGAQVIALDWVGIWWSLRLAAGGKAPGFEHVYIFGGEHADVDLRPESGALMADLVVDKHISVVLDVMHFRKAERTRFATAFAEQFFHRKKTARTACHLFIEEAQAYLPQMVRGDEARMVGVFEDIGKVGRNYGIGNSLISQRPQAINKDVLNQIEVLLAFQTNGPQERKAIAGWTSENTSAGAAMIQQLPTLQTGHALVWSPQWLRVSQEVHISTRETYDASSTPTTRAAAAVTPKRLAPADLEQLWAEIAKTIEKAKADDPRELRKRIAELDRELAKLRNSANRSECLTPVKDRPVLTDADRAALLTLADRHTERMKRLGDEVNSIAARLRSEMELAIESAGQRVEVLLIKGRKAFEKDVSAKGLNRLIEKIGPVPMNRPGIISTPNRTGVSGNTQRQRQHGARPAAGFAGATPRAQTARPASPAAGSGDAVSMLGTSGAYRMLCALAWRAPEPMTLSKLALRTGISRNGGTFRTYLGKLKTLGWAFSHGNAVAITEAGRGALNGDVPQPPRGEALIEYWQRELGNSGARRMFDAIVEAYPRPLSTAELEEKTGIAAAGGTFRTYLGQLRTLDLVTRGEIRASEELFS